VSVTTTHTAQDSPTNVDPRAIGLIAAVLALGSLALANFVGVSDSDNGGAAEFAITGGFALAVAGFVYGWSLPRALRSGNYMRAALVLTVLSVLGVTAFWSGLTQVAAPAAMLLGYRELQRKDGAGAAGPVAAIGFSALALLAAVAACVIG
jgi:hypothetical protein